MNPIPLLHRLSACSDAVQCVGDRDLASAWRECPRGDWLLWLAARLLPRPRVTLAACAGALLVLHLVPSGEERPRIAIETAEAWVRGEATIEQVTTAASASAVASAYASASASCVDGACVDGACVEGAARMTMSLRCADTVRSIVTADEIVAAAAALEVP